MKMNRYTLCMAAAALLAAFALTGCSLLKVAVATGDPLSKEEMNIRTMTRGFYYDMASEVSRTADSIAAAAPDIATRAAAVRWKIRATRAGVSAAMQGIPDVALADMWILCRRMDERFAAVPDSLLFGAQSDLARDAAARLDRRAARLARQVLAADRYGLMERFVADYVRENPADGEMEGSNTTLAWIEFLRANGIEHAYATGSIAEVLSDVNDRVSGQTQQLANSVGWSKDLIAMQLQQDSMRMEVGARLDSLERNFTRIVVVAEHLPEISDKVLEELNEQVTQLIYTMNYSLDNAFANFDRQRDELQRYVTAERQALVDQLRESADGVVQRTLDAVPGLVGKVLLYVVLALVVLVGLACGYRKLKTVGKVQKSQPWACGYAPNEHMPVVATTFASEVSWFMQPLYTLRDRCTAVCWSIAHFFQKLTGVAEAVEPVPDKVLVDAPHKGVEKLADLATKLEGGNYSIYICYIVAALVVFLVLAVQMG